MSLLNSEFFSKFSFKEDYLLFKDYLVIGDLHIGIEDDYIYSGVFIPRKSKQLIEERLNAILDNEKVKKLIILGDLKHVFGKGSFLERRELKEFLLFLKDSFSEIVLVKGNHDTFKDSFFNAYDILFQDHFFHKGVWFFHGHKGEVRERSVFAHEHPAISFSFSTRKETYKAFLLNQEKKFITVPAFNPIIVGTDFSREKPLGKMLDEENLLNSRPLIFLEKPFLFPKIRELYASKRHY